MAGDATTLHLSHVGLRAPDPAALGRFYEAAVGLARSEALPDGGVRLGLGRGHHALELSSGDGLDHFGLEVPSEGALDQIAQRLDAHGVAAERDRPTGDHPPVLRLSDPEGNRIELHGPIDRSGEGAADSGRRPVRIHHITLASPDVATLSDFYVEVLGFRVSDRMGDRFTWLRANREHHTVAVVHSETPGIDHYAWELSSWSDFKIWCDELAVRDVPVLWGPGRHGPGNNLFIMFDDAAGHHVELSCEMERYWDDAARYTPRIWSVSPQTVNLWGPTPDWRAPATRAGGGAGAAPGQAAR